MPADPTDDDPFLPIESTGSLFTSPFALVLVYVATIAMSISMRDLTPIAILSYLIVAWPVAETAFWLRDHDPIPRRGRTCFWLYLAYAGTVAAIKATFFFLALLAVFILTGLEPPIEPFIHLLAVMALGWIFSCVIGWIGIVLALARRIPVCIIPDLKRRCGGDLENLRSLPLPPRTFDRIVLVVTSSLSIPFLSVGFLLLILQPQMPGRPWMTSAGFSLLLAGALGAIAAVGLVSSRIAANPATAWPDYR